jgi:hypothetical protein
MRVGRDQVGSRRELTMPTLGRKIWERMLDFSPTECFLFDRPLVMLQSDDWGRAGLRDREGFDELQAAGIDLGERPYDLYTLETAEDLGALGSVLARHRDATGRSPVVVMNFITANLDFSKKPQSSELHFLPLADGLPTGWSRPGLFEAYREGTSAGFFNPALHGISHFCRKAVERHAQDCTERGALLRTLWKAGTPYIYWRMPWIGYEYWDPEQPADERFLGGNAQAECIGQAVGLFAKVFSTVPRSACAPGYRANADTNRSWSQYGIHCAQNGPLVPTAPHLDRHGVLQIYRAVEFEPATDESFSLETCLRQAETCFAARVPATVSIHSINFHSTVRDFRSRTLRLLDEFLGALESRYPDLLYVHDEDLYNLVQMGFYESRTGRTSVNVGKRRARKPAIRMGDRD